VILARSAHKERTAHKDPLKFLIFESGNGRIRRLNPVTGQHNAVRTMQLNNKINRIVRASGNGILFLFATLLPFLAYSQESGRHHPVEEYEHEKPGDPYLPNAFDNKKYSHAYRYDNHSGLKTNGNGIVTRQVNVEPGQQNIVGDAANEPSIAVNPLNENEIVIGWRQFDNVFSNFRQAGWAYSSDGGQTWTFPGCINPGKFQSDPVLDYDNSGNFYYNSLESTSSSFPCFVYQSDNGGLSWKNRVYIGGGDKQWMSVDRSGGIGEGNIYSSWTWSTTDCESGFFTRSTDGGISFDTCSMIPEDISWAAEAVGNNGELYLAGRSPSTAAVRVVKSADAQDSSQSISWPQVTTCNLGGYMTAFTPLNPVGLTGQPCIDVDRSNGPGRDNVYVVCSVQPYTNSDPADVMFNKSTNGGLTWNNAAPVRVNDDTDIANIQWFGTMSVAPNGRIDVIWLDTRDHPGSDSSALYYSYSIDQGDTWSVNEKLSDSFDPHIGYPNQQKMGDYFDMVSSNAGVHLAWANTLNGEQDVYYSFITPQIPLGMDEISGNLMVSVFPNPTSGLLEISCPGKKIRIEMFTILGKEVFSTPFFNTGRIIDISSQPAGIYFLKLVSDDGRETIRKIIRK
jgi:hypothetical protein